MQLPCCGDREAKGKGLTAKLPRSAGPSGDKSARGPKDRTDTDDSQAKAPGEPEEPVIPASPFGKLTVKIIKGEGLKGQRNAMAAKLVEKKTLDASVRLSINDDHPFGISETKFKSKGDPAYGSLFDQDLIHPKSYLVVSVCDGDAPDVPGGDVPGGNLMPTDAMFKGMCGYVEIPLWEMPINQLVSGWFTLRPPPAGGSTIQDHQDEIAKEAEDLKAAEEAKAKEATEAPPTNGNGKATKEQEKKDAAEKEDKDVGRVRLEIMLSTTKGKEFHGYIDSAAPHYKRSLPPMDLVAFIENCNECKRICLERLVLPPLLTVKESLSWKKVAVSAPILLWHIWISCYPAFWGASVCVAAILCFWHKPWEEPVEDEGLHLGDAAGRVGSKFKDAGSSLVSKPGEAMKKGDVKGFMTGAFGGVADAVKNTGEGVLQAGKEGIAMGGKAVTAVGEASSGGAAQLQQCLRMKPEFGAVILKLQPKVEKLKKLLQKVDDIIYLKDKKLSMKVVGAIAGALVLCIIFRPSGFVTGWLWYFSGWGYLFAGAVGIMFQAPWFKRYLRMGLAAKGVLTRPKAPFAKALWYKEEK